MEKANDSKKQTVTSKKQQTVTQNKNKDEITNMTYNMEQIKLTGTIYVLVNTLDNEEILTEKSLISYADSSSYCNNGNSICNLDGAIEYFKDIGFKVYKLTNIQIDNLTK